MAGDWIKVRSVLPDDGRLLIASRKCHATSVTTLGALVTLWCFADAHADENGVLLGYDASAIDERVKLPGFCESLPPDWIDLSGEWVKLPEYQEHNGTTAKARAQTTKRKQKERSATNVTDRSRNERDTSVTREEKRREEKKEQKQPAAAVDLFEGVSPNVVRDFKALRKLKRAAITETALDDIKREAGKAGMTFEAALTMCCARGWSSFRASWLLDKSGQSPQPAAPRQRKQLGEGSSTDYGSRDPAVLYGTGATA